MRGPMADTPAQDRALGLQRVRLGSRYLTAYSPELGLKVCEGIAEGKTLKSICSAANNMPHWLTFMRWVLIYPDLREAYHEAKELSAQWLEEEALQAGRDGVANPGSAQDVRSREILMNQLRWSASKRNPRQYSDRGALQVTVPVQINTSLDLEGKQGGSQPQNTYHLEATVVQEPGEEARTEVLLPPAPEPFAEPKKVGRRRKAETDKIANRRQKGKGKKMERAYGM